MKEKNETNLPKIAKSSLQMISNEMLYLSVAQINDTNFGVALQSTIKSIIRIHLHFRRVDRNHSKSWEKIPIEKEENYTWNIANKHLQLFEIMFSVAKSMAIA